MTSEVAVMNRYAVALAADSAVTVNGGNGSKVYNSANKLFSLSKYHPVGVMFYNNAALLGVPWETIVKLYRSNLGHREFDSVSEYGNDLVGFLDGNTHLFPENIQDGCFKYSVERMFRGIEDTIRRNFFDKLFESTPNRQANRDGDAQQEIVDHLNAWRKKENAACFSEGFVQKIHEKYDIVITGIIDVVFGGYNLTDEARLALIELAGLLVIKDEYLDNYSGLVISGFGRNEYFPVLQSFQIGEIFLGKLKFKQVQLQAIDNDNPVVVQPFAQDEMVTTFLQGMNPKYRMTLLRGMVSIAFQLPEAAIDAIADLSDEQKEKWKKEIKPHSKQAIEVFVKDINDYRVQNHSNPIHQAIVFLQKDDLAQVAETLVSLNSFQKRMSMDAETVGGPIDVAVISKGDGLVWIKRKHYFSQELNRQFLYNYNS